MIFRNPTNPFIPSAILLAAAMTLAGCASYRARPLSLAPPLRIDLASLDRTPQGGRVIDATRPLSPQALAALAVLNDPALAAARAQIGIGRAQIFAAGLLPDPNIQGGFGALLGGPGTAPSISGALAQDLASLITRGARLHAARARAAEIGANVMWQEWQVASQAETLAVSLWADRRSLATLDAARSTLRGLVATSRQAVASGNLAIDQASAAQASLASLDTAHDAVAQQEQTDHAALAALLGVTPNTPIPLARPRIPRLPHGVTRNLVVTLARRRPDLIALRYGYRAADADLRAAILAQFPLLSLSVNGGSDTSRVASLGPTISLNLPIFNGNRGNIAVAKATRRQLDAAFTAALGVAQGQTDSAEQALALLGAERRAAKARLVSAATAAHAARRAYRAGLIDARIETDLIDQAATRQTELIALDQKNAAGRIALASLLGAGLPVVSHTGGAP
ncbi:TolC family protein [Acidiphilium sp. AL]|uniref:TolC family protein n=1 Tax=Acidiphilium sp. AL TaxID=2871704 RepID=UPI0021CB8DA4|nr:TolC family protein [Acidiphilium sp. AL]MCU4160748.1 TolC family protein [Acidiphilium sp. AL]